MYKKIVGLVFGKCDNTFIQLVKYCFVGVVATSIDYLVFYLFDKIIPEYYLVANTIAFVCGLLLSYELSCLWVFESRQEKAKVHPFVAFSIIGIIGLVFNSAIMFLFVEYIGVGKLYAKSVATVLVLLWNFFARKKIVFK